MLKAFFTALLYPLGTSLTAITGGFLFLAFGKRRAALMTLGFGLFWLLLWSFPPASDALVRHLEQTYAHATIETLQPADLIVVFGGGMAPGGPIHPYPDLSAAADRVWHAARVYHAGLAPRILVSGGYYRYQGDWPSDAYSMRRFLHDLGVPDSAIVSDSLSTSSYENALHTNRIMTEQGWNSLILVTSALHMPRSMLTMQSFRPQTQAAPTDYLAAAEVNRKWDLRPSARYLSQSTQAFHEWIGLLWYRLRGWIGRS